MSARSKCGTFTISILSGRTSTQAWNRTGRSPLSSLSRFVVKLTGVVRAPHALILLLAFICYLFFRTASEMRVADVPEGSFLLFALLILVVSARFILRGPDAERMQPTVSVTHYGIHIY